MNLDLGGTIWLDVTRKLLSFHKWFFSKFEDMPKAVREEFHHHSHTHPNVTVDTLDSGEYYGHVHDMWTEMMDCGNPNHYEHNHNVLLVRNDYHVHSVELSFGAADLGVPNWWEHVHPITLVSCSNAGGSHKHTFPSTTLPYGCGHAVGTVYCIMYPHVHDCSSVFGESQAAGAAHAHTIGAVNTADASSGETALNHKHPFSFGSELADSHSHQVLGAIISETLCHYNYNHEHGVPDFWYTPLREHRHTISGETGYGGEAPPPPVVKAGLNIPKVLPIILGG